MFYSNKLKSYNEGLGTVLGIMALSPIWFPAIVVTVASISSKISNRSAEIKFKKANNFLKKLEKTEFKQFDNAKIIIPSKEQLYKLKISEKDLSYLDQSVDKVYALEKDNNIIAVYAVENDRDNNQIKYRYMILDKSYTSKDDKLFIEGMFEVYGKFIGPSNSINKLLNKYHEKEINLSIIGNKTNLQANKNFEYYKCSKDEYMEIKDLIDDITKFIVSKLSKYKTSVNTKYCIIGCAISIENKKLLEYIDSEKWDILEDDYKTQVKDVKDIVKQVENKFKNELNKFPIISITENAYDNDSYYSSIIIDSKKNITHENCLFEDIKFI